MASTFHKILIGVGCFIILLLCWLVLFQADKPTTTHEDASPAPPLRSVREIVSQLPKRESSEDETNSETVVAEHREFIKNYRTTGAEFLVQQQQFVEAIPDRNTRRELEHALTTANRLWLAAVFSEMVRHQDYRASVINIMNDGQFRRFAIDSLGDLMPDLVHHLKTGRRVSESNVDALFEDSADYQGAYAAMNSQLPEELVPHFESEIAALIAGDVLHWQFLQDHSGSPSESSFQFFWGGRMPDPLD